MVIGRNIVRSGTWALTLALCLSPLAARAASYGGGDPNWPCVQRLMPTLSAAALWSNLPVAEAGDWQADERVTGLVNRIAPRPVTAADGIAAIDDFAKGLSPEDRARLLPLVFLGLVDETNEERGILISRLKDFGERQSSLAKLVARLGAERDAMVQAAPDAADPKRDELEQRLVYTTRAFEELQSTIRYACETPVALEARLGSYARALQADLK